MRIFKMFFKCVLLLLLPFTCFGEEEPDVEVVKTNMGCRILPPGASTSFDCPFNNYFNYSYPMKWQKVLENYSVLDLTKNTELITDDHRFTVAYKREIYNDIEKYALGIRDIRDDDSGRYHCEIELPNGPKRICGIHLMVAGSANPALLRNTSYFYLNVAVMVFIVGLARSKN